jgi:hypothetical protein
MKGDTAEAGPEGPRGASNEDFAGGASATLDTLARRSGGRGLAAFYKALKWRRRAEIEDTVGSAQGKSKVTTTSRGECIGLCEADIAMSL